MKLEIPYIEVEQPIGTFYLSAINAKTLVDIVEIRRRNSDNVFELSLFERYTNTQEQGVQRAQSKERVNKIKDYCSDPDATFPTPIIISIYSDVSYIDKNNRKSQKFFECLWCGNKIQADVGGSKTILVRSSDEYSNITLYTKKEITINLLVKKFVNQIQGLNSLSLDKFNKIIRNSLELV